MWFDKIKKYYESGTWTINMVSAAVDKKKITEEEYKTITGESYSGGSSKPSLEERVTALEEALPSMTQAVNDLADLDKEYTNGVNSI